MSAVDVETPAVRQHLIQLPVVIGIRAVPALPRPRIHGHRAMDFHFHSPKGLRSRQCRIMSDDGEGIGDRIDATDRVTRCRIPFPFRVRDGFVGSVILHGMV